MPKERSGRFRCIRRIRVPTLNLDARMANARNYNERGEPDHWLPVRFLNSVIFAVKTRRYFS